MMLQNYQIFSEDRPFSDGEGPDQSRISTGTRVGPRMETILLIDYVSVWRRQTRYTGVLRDEETVLVGPRSVV